LPYGHRSAALYRHQLPPLGLTEIHFAHAPLTRCIFIGSID
jgi:hypothetical protein